MSEDGGDSPEHIEPTSGPATAEGDEAEGSIPDASPVGSMIPEGESIRPASVDDLERAIGSLGDRLDGRLDAIRAILEREARAEATRERVVDRLHAELQEYKQDLLLKVQRPIFIDLIQLHDDIGKMIEARAIAEGDADRVAAVRGILESIQVAIEDILYRQGVEPFAADGDAFDPRRQRAVATVAIGDPSRNKTIAARLRKGFQAGDRLIRPELVSVYTALPSSTADPLA